MGRLIDSISKPIIPQMAKIIVTRLDIMMKRMAMESFWRIGNDVKCEQHSILIAICS